MTKFPLFFASTLALTLTTGWPATAKNNEGTVTSANRCINSHGGAGLLSAETIKRRCIMDQQIEVSPQTSEAYARFGLYAHPFDDRPEKATAKAFIANGKNMSDDVVITEIHVEFEFHDVTGKPYRKHAVMQTWIEPSWDLEGEVSATGFMFPEDLSVKHVNEYQCRGTQNYLCKGGKIIGYRGLKIE